MRLLKDNLIGYTCPYFLNNNGLGNSYYIYQIASPGMSPNIFPWVTLKKISEKTNVEPGGEPFGRGNDLLSIASGIEKPGKNKKRTIEWLRNGYRYFPAEIKIDRDEFPLFELDPVSTNTQRNLVILLRDAIRWGRYRFFNDRLIDVLYDREHFITFKIHTKEDGMVKITPLSMYKMKDANLSNPMSIPSHINFPEEFNKEHKDVGNGKCPTLCQAIKKFEWESFDRGVFWKERDK